MGGPPGLGPEARVKQDLRRVWAAVMNASGRRRLVLLGACLIATVVGANQGGLLGSIRIGHLELQRNENARASDGLTGSRPVEPSPTPSLGVIPAKVVDN